MNRSKGLWLVLVLLWLVVATFAGGALVVWIVVELIGGGQ